MTSGDQVHVVVFVYKGIVEGVEVFTEPEAAKSQADEWRKQADELDTVSTLVRELK